MLNCVSVEMGFLLGFAQTHFIFLSWYKKTKQKKIKADVPSRPAKCLFTKRRKLVFGSDSSTFLTLISHSRYPVSPHRPICFVQAQITYNGKTKKGEHMGSPLRIRVLNDVAQTIRELSVRGRWLSGGGYRCEYANFGTYTLQSILTSVSNVRSIYLQILLRSDSEITTRGYPRRDNLLNIFTEPISYGEKE